MNPKTSLLCLLALVAFAGTAVADRATWTKEVRDAEQAFAATMVKRDHAAFERHLAADAVFFDGEKAVQFSVAP